MDLQAIRQRTYTDPAATTDVAELVEMVDKLRAAVLTKRAVAEVAARYWDADQDSKVGKNLWALAGMNPGYRHELEDICRLMQTIDGPLGIEPERCEKELAELRALKGISLKGGER